MTSNLFWSLFLASCSTVVADRDVSTITFPGQACDDKITPKLYTSPSPGAVETLEQCVELCRVSGDCASVTFYELSKWCTHFYTACESLKPGHGATTVTPEVNPYWTLVGYGKECLKQKGESLHSSVKVESLEQCIASCDLAADCKSVTFFVTSQFCSHFSSMCEKDKTKETANAISMMKRTQHSKCDMNAGEVFRTESSGGVSDLAACKKSCEDDAKCKGITFFTQSKYCSHFSTDCTKRTPTTDTIAMTLKTGKWMRDEPTGCDTKSGTPGAVTCSTSSCDSNTMPAPIQCPKPVVCAPTPTTTTSTLALVTTTTTAIATTTTPTSTTSATTTTTAAVDKCPNGSPSKSLCARCNAGFMINTEQTKCSDVDECLENNGGCHSQRKCINTVGSMKCGDCPVGYVNDGAKGCTDVDECLKNKGGCDIKRKCINTAGSMKCDNCPAGYDNDGAKSCKDVDECATNNGGCHSKRKCINTVGSMSCDDCQAGYYTNDGAKGCKDVDECATNDGGCDSKRKCVNTVGSMSCDDCPAGYVNDGAKGCKDVDECATNNGGCHSKRKCVNTVGSMSCDDCPAGYTNDGAKGCKDVDECATNNGGCHSKRKCVNTVGSMSCDDCPAGYTNDGAKGCKDVDECATNDGGCDSKRKCVNTVGSMSCDDCPAGYTNYGAKSCKDVDECATNNGGCHSKRKCVNTVGSMSCDDCPAGYTNDGAKGCKGCGFNAISKVPTDGLVSWFQSTTLGKSGNGGNSWKSTVGSFTAKPLGGTVQTVNSAGHGAFGAVRMVTGTTATSYTFGNVIGGTVSICSLSRYTGENKGRILTSKTASNFLHGHWRGRQGVAYYNGWLGSSSSRVKAQNNWVVLCSTSKRLVLNGKTVATRTNTWEHSEDLVINSGAYAAEASDWGVAEVITWNRELNEKEMQDASAYLKQILDGGTSFGGNCPTVYNWIRPSSCRGVSGEPCPKAIDGNTATSYAPSVESGSITFDLGRKRFVDGVELWKHSNAKDNGIKSVTISTSLDKNSFSEQKKQTSVYKPGTNNFEHFLLYTTVSARYVRVDFTNYGNPRGKPYTSFWSVKVRTVAATVIADWIRPYSCVGVNDESCPEAIDGNTATWYKAPQSGSITFDLGLPLLVDEMELWKHSNAGSNGINSVTIFTSLDRKSFSEQKKQISPIVPTNNFERFFLDTTVSARYVRVDFTNYGKYFTAFWEVKFRIVLTRTTSGGWN